MAGISLVTALAVGGINTASAFIAYRSFLPRQPISQSQPLITSETVATSATLPASQPASSTTPSATTPTPTVRPSSTPLVAGQPAQPAQVTTNSSGQVSYRWCSGTNPKLDDAVCEAIASIIANPTRNNPHLSAKAKQFLSLLPADVSLTMDETSWVASSPNSGTLVVNAHTKRYGNIRLQVTMQKINGVWMLTDGKLA